MDAMNVPQLLSLAEIYRCNHKYVQCEKLIVAAINKLSGRPESGKDDPVTYESALTSLQQYRVYTQMGKLLIETKRPEQALEFLQLALTSFLEVNAAHFSCFGSLTSSASTESSKNFLQGIELNIEDSVCYYNINIALRQIGRMAEAIDLSCLALHRAGADIAEASVFHSDVNVAANDKKEREESNDVTFVLVKWGTKYNCEYVNRLARDLIHTHRPRHLQLEVHPQCIHEVSSVLRVICFTDDPIGIDDGVICKALPTSSSVQGWWTKSYLFSSEAYLPEGLIVYLDLDTIITGDYEFLLHLNREALQILSASQLFTTEGRDCGYNSSVMVWYNTSGNSNRYASVYNFIQKYYSIIMKYIYKFDHFLEMVFMNSTLSPSSLKAQELLSDSIIDFQSLLTRSHSTLDPSLHSDVCIGGIKEDFIGGRESSDYSGQILNAGRHPSLVPIATVFPIPKDAETTEIISENGINSNSSDFTRSSSCIYSHSNNNSSDKMDGMLVNEELISQRRIGIVTFPLFPKPHDLIDLPWIHRVWVNGRQDTAERQSTQR